MSKLLPPPPIDSARPFAAARQKLRKVLCAKEEEIIAVRRHLHQHPELSGEEFRTTAYLAHKLEATGLPFRLAPSGRGIIVDSQPASEAPRPAFRADIDALHIQDLKSVAYRSMEALRMHACGHDAHTAMALGAIWGLAAIAPELPPEAAWRAVFQPAEESAAGAFEMIAAGALEGISEIIALHVDPLQPAGKVCWREGPLTALCDDFEIELHGRGGHGARPFETTDPLAAATALVQAAYASLPRRLDARSAVVLSFGQLVAGNNPNVIPSEAFLAGTLRTLNEAASKAARESLRQIIEGVAAAHGIKAELRHTLDLAGVVNDKAITQSGLEAARSLTGEANLHAIELPSMGGEDFANYLRHVPGAMFRLGVGFPGRPPVPLHSPEFDLNEDALLLGSLLLAEWTLELIAKEVS